VKGKICRLGRLVAANIELDLFYWPCLGRQGYRVWIYFIGLALVGKDIVFGFILEYSSLMDFGS
jgi:hypothetical protein